MKKKEVKTYSADEVRQKILAYLSACRKKARGLDSLMASSSDIKKTLGKEGVSQNETVQNLDYLVQHGWVDEKVTKRPYKTPKGFEVPNEKHLFGLSELGLKYTEGESDFDRSGVFSGININNIGGVTVVGNGNVVRNEFVDVLRSLNQLEGAVKVSGELTEDQKLGVQADIQTIKSQLSKPNPDKSILQRAMDGIAFVGALPGVAEVFKVAAHAVQSIIGS